MVNDVFKIWVLAIVIAILVLMLSLVGSTSNEYGFLEGPDGYYEPISNKNATVAFVESGETDHIKIVRSSKEFNAYFEKAGKKDSNVDDRIIVTRYHASWCGPCRASEASWQKLAVKYKNMVVFLDIDIDKLGSLAVSQGVEGVPTFVVSLKGKEIGRQVGFSSTLKTTEVLMRKAHKIDLENPPSRKKGLLK